MRFKKTTDDVIVEIAESARDSGGMFISYDGMTQFILLPEKSAQYLEDKGVETTKDSKYIYHIDAI